MRLRMIEKRYIHTSGGQIHLRLTPHHHLPPLVLLHQTASSSAMYEKLMHCLADHFWLIAPDMSGFGQSDPPTAANPTIPLHATLFWELLDHLNIQKAHLFGHHTGASVAVQMAHDQPQRVNTLALSGPPLLTAAQIEFLEKGLLPIEIDPNGRFLRNTWDRIRKKEPAAPLTLSLRESLLTIQAAENYPAAYRAVFAHPLANQLAALTCPTLLMAGEQDSLIASLEPAASYLPPTIPQQIHRIPQAGSYICDQQPDLVAQILRSFLQAMQT